MRVLWVCNIMLPIIAEELGLPYSNKEGWLTGLSGRILEEAKADVSLGVCFPYAGKTEQKEEQVPPKSERTEANEQERMEDASELSVPSRLPLRGTLSQHALSYYGFTEDTIHEESYDPVLELAMREIITDFQPDLIHIFGTEYGHTLAAVRAYGRTERTLVGIQGVCYVYADHYLDGLPEQVIRRSTPRDLLKKDNLLQQQTKMKKRGQRETEALRLTGHVTGRTHFDREAVARINPHAEYHFMNETMRSNFYEPQWHFETCEKYSVFLSQGNYPIKGLHFMLRALALLVKRYPEIHVYVAGDQIIREKSLLARAKISSYGKYLAELMEESSLRSHVTFTGPLNGEDMCRYFLKAHVFASVSTIENSPNSIGEAMLLGVPVVSSEVGGVTDMMTDGVEGLLYTTENVSALTTAVTRIFEDRELAERLSEAARVRARITHDPDTNFRRLMEIYHDINLCK